jgi:hypothetical protein
VLGDRHPYRDRGRVDPEYIAKMEDTLGIYEKPYDPGQPVVCLDEKPISLHDDVRPPVPVKPGKPAKQNSEYKRCGTANVFGVVEPKTGHHFTIATPNRSGAECARIVGHVVKQYPAASTIHLVRTTSTYTPVNRRPITSASRRVETLGTGSLCTTPQNTEAGSIRRKSNSACTRGSVWANGGLQICRSCGVKPRPGTVRPTRSGRRSTGGSRGRKPERYSSTNRPAATTDRDRTCTQPTRITGRTNVDCAQKADTVGENHPTKANLRKIRSHRA